MTSRSNHITRFLNVDLDIYSKSDLEPLIKALGENAFVLHSGRERRYLSAHLELSRVPTSADAAIRGFVALILRLPRTAQKLWKTAISRSFNIGIQGGRAPQSYEVELAPATLREVAALKAQLVVTVYGRVRVRRVDGTH